MSELSLQRVLDLVDGVPDVERFPTVDEVGQQLARIAEEHSDIVRRRRIGSSRLGDPIETFSVGSGSDHALVIGGVHPNEPIGGVTTVHLLRLLASDPGLLDQFGCTWHVIGCVDPDGTRLNEGWFGGDLDRAEYGRRFFRPASDEQVEWTFPLSYKDMYFDRVMPETLALMRIIDETRPTFLCSLHNGELGGVYYYVSDDTPDLYPALHAVPKHVGLPLDTGEPEVPFVPRHASAVFGHVSMERFYDYAEGLGMDPTGGLSTGSSSADYASRYGTFALVSEVPYWAHPDAADDSPSDQTYRKVLEQRGRGLADLGLAIGSVLAETEGDRILESPYLRAMRQFAPAFVRDGEQESLRAAQPGSERPATVAEVYSGADTVHGFRMRYGGMTLRLLGAEIEAGNGTPVIRAQQRRLAQLYDEWAVEALKVTPTHALPIRSLVGVQLGAILAGASYAVGRHGPAGAGA